MTGAALGPEVVAQREAEVAIAVGILEQAAALDAIRVLDTIQSVAGREVHGPDSGGRLSYISHLHQ